MFKVSRYYAWRIATVAAIALAIVLVQAHSPVSDPTVAQAQEPIGEIDDRHELATRLVIPVMSLPKSSLYYPGNQHQNVLRTPGSVDPV